MNKYTNNCENEYLFFFQTHKYSEVLMITFFILDPLYNSYSLRESTCMSTTGVDSRALDSSK